MEGRGLKEYAAMDDPQGFAEFVRGLAERLLHDPACDTAPLEKPIDGIVTYLDSLLEFYRSPSPPFTETIREYMLQGLDLYRQCLMELRAFFRDKSEERVRRSIALAGEAEDILKSLDIVMAESAEMLGLEGSDGA